MDIVNKADIEKLSLLRKILYGVGDSTNSLFFTVFAFFYLYFLTDVAGLDPSLAGFVLLATKGWDALTNPMMGFISDHTKTRWGRRRPYFLAAIPSAACFFFIWYALPIADQTYLFLAYVGLNILFWTFFAMMAIPYAALMPELTLDYDDRTSLISVRMAFSIVFGLAAAVVPLQIVNMYPQKTTGFAMMALILGIFGIFPYIISFFGTKERPEFSQKASLSLLTSLKETLKNRAYVISMIIFLLSWACVDIIGAIFIYYVIYWMGLSDGDVSICLGTLFVTAILFLPFWVWFSKKLGKRAAYIAGMSFWALVMCLTYFLHPGIPVTILYGFCFLAGIGISTAHLVPWAMIVDCVDIDEYNTGSRREGMYIGFTLFSQKIFSAVSLLFIGKALGWWGYTANMIQTETALKAIRILMGPIPAVLLILSIVLAFFYPITKKGHEEVRRELDLKNSIKA